VHYDLYPLIEIDYQRSARYDEQEEAASDAINVAIVDDEFTFGRVAIG
jgi:hypothetical protein